MVVKVNKKEETREKNIALILDAAQSLFAQLGYDGASMSMIAKEAAVPKANVLYYFKSKDNLYEAVLERIIGSWNLGLEGVSVEDDPAVVLYSYIYNKVRLAIAEPMQSRLFATEIIRGAPYLQDYIRKQTRPWVRARSELFEAWMSTGKMKRVDPVHLLFHIWSMTQYYADFQAEVLLVMNKQEYEADDLLVITDNIAQLVLGGVGLSIPSPRVLS